MSPDPSRAAPATVPRETASLPPSVAERVGPPYLLVLATAALDGTPATTLVAWVCARDESTLLIALDRRGLAYENAVDNPAAALEIVLDGFAATARGRLTILREDLRKPPFPCAAFVFDIDEVRLHTTPGVSLAPARYVFDDLKEHYAVNEVAVIAELRALAEGRQP